MGNLMDAFTQYAESDKTKDSDSDEDKSGQGRKAGGKGQNNGNQNQQNKRWLDQNASDLVANNNTGYQRQKQGASIRRQKKTSVQIVTRGKIATSCRSSSD